MSQKEEAGGILPESLKDWLRDPQEQDRVYPKNKKIEIVFLIEAVNAILPRTEGVEDITLIKLPGTEYEVPVILPEKLQAVARRRMLAHLRRFRDANPEELKKHLEKLVNMYKIKAKKKGKEVEMPVSFIKAKQILDNPEQWNCYIQPPGGDISKATDVGMDAYCPACALFGTVITDETLEIRDTEKNRNIFAESVGVKSRVEFDPAFAIMDQEKSVASYTHNKVSDGVSWTGKSLYEEKHVVPGTIFVGKVTLEDVTEAELKGFLATLATLDRLGGRERLFGTIRVHLAGIRGGSYETVSALELARKLASKFGDRLYPPSVDEVLNELNKILVGSGDARFTPISTSEFKKLAENMETWDNLWKDTVEYDKQIVYRILKLIRGEEKIT